MADVKFRETVLRDEGGKVSITTIDGKAPTGDLAGREFDSLEEAGRAVDAHLGRVGEDAPSKVASDDAGS